MEKEALQSRIRSKPARTSEVHIINGQNKAVKVFTFSNSGSGETHVELVKINNAGWSLAAMNS